MLVRHNGKVHSTHMACQDVNGMPWLLPKKQQNDKAQNSVRRQLQLPADYDGWLEYTAAQNENGYDAFVGTFSVPDLPAGLLTKLRRKTHNHSQVLVQSNPIFFICSRVRHVLECGDILLWAAHADENFLQGYRISTGSLRWTPCQRKTSILSSQYCSTLLMTGMCNIEIGQAANSVSSHVPSCRSNSWSVKSWYVTVNNGAYYSPDMKVSVGDNIFGNMTRLGPQQWLVDSVSHLTGNHTTIHPSSPRLASQPWAYNTVECYGCNGCSTYPKYPCLFRHLALECTGEGACPAQWVANPKDDKPKQCKEQVVIESSEKVVFYFQ